MKIGIFTRNQGKVLGVRMAFKDVFGLDVKVIPIYRKSLSLPKQPTSLEESLAGAKKRAEYCYKVIGDLDYSVGLEGGIHSISVEDLNLYIGFHIAYILDIAGEAYIGVSSAYQVPNQYVDDILADEMASVLERLTGSRRSRENIGLVGYLSDKLVTRVDLAYEAVRNALFHFKRIESERKL